MNFLFYIISLYFLQSVFGQFTLKKNKLLKRRKRYLMFPKGANFVVSKPLNLNIVDLVALDLYRLLYRLGT